MMGASVKNLGTAALGTIVKIKESSVVKNFIVLSHGYPTSGRTLLLRVNTVKNSAWENTSNNYSASTVDSWLNGTYLSTIDAAISAKILAVSIQSAPGNSDNTAVAISRKVFLLSGTEVQLAYTPAVVEGSAIAYFSSNSQRIVLDETSVAVNWWLRTPIANTSNMVMGVYQDGTATQSSVNNSWGYRPAFTLPDSCAVADDGTVS